MQKLLSSGHSEEEMYFLPLLTAGANLGALPLALGGAHRVMFAGTTYPLAGTKARGSKHTPGTLFPLPGAADTLT